ncbi:hypothetical protein FKQ52_04525 [Brevundimonas sp. M20]|nr:hypothetical protein FKQ52_04525 [Brevundimonas sp. M20]
MRCALCGSGMTLNGGKYACSAARERGTCKNNKIIAARTVEDRVLTGVRRHLLSPEAIASAVRIFHEEQSTRRLEALAARAPTERELNGIRRKLERARMMFTEEMITIDELRARAAPLTSRRSQLEALIAPSPFLIVAQLSPSARKRIARLADAPQLAIMGDMGEDLRRGGCKLIEVVEFVPPEELGRFEPHVRGHLAGLRQISQA